MSGTALSSCKTYLVDTLLPSLFPSAEVVWGWAPDTAADDVVMVLNAQVQNSQPVYGTQRPVEETMSLQVTISCWRAGGREAQRTASLQAMSMYSTLRDYFKTNANETLGGICRWVRVVSYELAEDDDEEAMHQGRLAQVDVVLSIRARN